VLSLAERSLVEQSGFLGRCQFPPPGTAVVLGVSGGADSTAMLALALACELDVSAVHVDHGLRAAASMDALLVARTCDRWNVPVEVRSVVVTPGPNLEARARSARYAALPSGVLTGHTADDLVETVLLNMLRGAGLDGLAPMRDRPWGPRRPLLRIRRAETVALCRALDVEVVQDEMNTDDRFRRVRVRCELVPLMADIAARDVTAVIARQVDALAADAALLDELSLSVDPTDALSVGRAPQPLAVRAVRRWLAEAGATPRPVGEQAVIERVLRVARGEATSTEIGGGWTVRRTTQRLRLELPTNR
jgi:tRNA(Ile)-lysidine synthase